MSKPLPGYPLPNPDDFMPKPYPAENPCPYCGTIQVWDEDGDGNLWAECPNEECPGFSS